MAVHTLKFGVNPPEAELGQPSGIISGQPKTKLTNYFTDPSGQFFSGVWESSTGKWSVNYTESEFCMILKGRAILTAADGHVEEYGPGDAFIIPSGFSGTWETVEPVQKLYAICEAKK